MTSPYLDIPLFPLGDARKAGVKAFCATVPHSMPDYSDHAPPSEDYRQLAQQLRELAQQTRRAYARQELLRLSGIYERRAEHLDRRAD
jgi:hypothetical protein